MVVAKVSYSIVDVGISYIWVSNINCLFDKPFVKINNTRLWWSALEIEIMRSMETESSFSSTFN